MKLGDKDMDDKIWIDKFIQLFSNYQLREAFTLKEAKIPSKLYIYARINENTCFNLQNNTMYAQTPILFNDPYDCITKIRYGEYLNTKYNKSDIDTEEYKELKKAVVSEAQILEDKIKEFVLNDLRIICLTPHWNNMLMWSHYADSYKGICIEYDWSSLATDDFFRIRVFPVKYSNAFRDYTFDYNKINGYKTLAALYKSDCWNYENEWRVVFTDKEIYNGNYIMKMPRISKIILGSRISNTDKAMIINYANKLMCDITQIELSKDEYKLEEMSI